MISCVIATRISVAVLLALTASAADLTLQVSNETVPAGGWAQIKIFAATPQKVGFGRIAMRLDPMVFGSITAAAVFSPQGDATGIASVSGPTLDVTFTSRAGGLGQLAQLPILTVIVPVLATAAPGTVSAVTIDASRGQWTDLGNNPYTVITAPGSVTVGGSVSIQSLDPAGALLSAGAVVRLKGVGFSASTVVTIDGVSVSSTNSFHLVRSM